MVTSFILFLLFITTLLVSFYFSGQLGTKKFFFDLFSISLGLFNLAFYMYQFYNSLIQIERVGDSIIKINLEMLVLKQQIIELKILASAITAAESVPILEICTCPLVPVFFCAVGVLISGIKIAAIFNLGTFTILYTTKSWFYPILAVYYPLKDLNLAEIALGDNSGNNIRLIPDIIHDTFTILVQPASMNVFIPLENFISMFPPG